MGADVGQSAVCLIDAVDSANVGGHRNWMQSFLFFVEFIDAVDCSNPKFLFVL